MKYIKAHAKKTIKQHNSLGKSIPCCNNGSKFSKIFINGGSQAIRIPAEYKFADNVKEVQVERKGDCIILRAIQPSYENLMNAVNNFSDDFMNDRIQPEIEQRDLF